MRRHITLLVLGIFLCVFFAPISAHSPSDMQVAYDRTPGELVVTITHGVRARRRTT